MRGQTGRRGEAEAWGEGIQQMLWNSIGGGRPQSGLDFQPSRPSWHSFQAQNVISVRGSGPRNKGGPDVTPVSVGTLPRTNGTWDAGDAPRLPIMGSRCFSHSTRHGIFDLQSCPSHVGWRMSMSLSCHGSPAFHLRESFTGGGCRLAATAPPRREKLFLSQFAINRIPTLARMTRTSWMQIGPFFGACKTPFFLFHGASPFVPSPSPTHFFASPDTFPEAENEAFLIK